MTTYAIGDIQGCHSSLLRLLDCLGASSNDSRFLFVGDLINRGPQSLQTIRKIKVSGNKTKVLLGNHDLHLLAVAHGIRQNHRSDTVQEILDAPDRKDLLDWLRHQPLALFEDGHLLVHAGVLPQWTVKKTLALAQEVESTLRGPNWLDFLQHMYGNEPARWRDDLQGYDRLRCIVNALTRIRFCSVDGTMEFTTKEDSTPPESGYMPWFDVPGRKTADTPIVFGHWSTLGLLQRPNLLGIDTGCVWGGKLTAVRLEDHAIFQVDCPQYCKPG
jgi:bis(5'-nucleosyl)-tetraphosphatase (symmetrical)